MEVLGDLPLRVAYDRLAGWFSVDDRRSCHVDGPTGLVRSSDARPADASRQPHPRDGGHTAQQKGGSVPPDGPPPLLIRPHPGPTSQTGRRLDPDIQFFTSHGFAVADVDYRGSTGYGRAYREALSHHWGVADAEDCIVVARWLVDNQRADFSRTVISGPSVGGFTALRRTDPQRCLRGRRLRVWHR